MFEKNIKLELLRYRTRRKLRLRLAKMFSSLDKKIPNIEGVYAHE